MECTLKASFLSGTRRGLAVLVFVGAAILGAKSMLPKVLCEGFLPANTMKIPVGSRIRSNFFEAKAVGGITEDQFNRVMDRIQKLYGPVVAQQGGVLTIERKWSDPTVNASAEQINDQWILNMYGGLARHQETTEEGMALVACHELGHHLGGAPKNHSWAGDDWATDEGGADYFATLKCLRNYFAEDDNETILAAATLDPLARTRCASEFTDHVDQLLCLRTSMAATSGARLFMDMRGEAVVPSFATPDQSITKFLPEDNPDPNTNPHPATQCRMDTYFNGAICHVSKTVSNSKTDYRDGSCVQGVDQFGWRPLCWFKAPN